VAPKPYPRAVQDKGETVLTRLAVFQTAGWRFQGTIALINITDALLMSMILLSPQIFMAALGVVYQIARAVRSRKQMQTWHERAHYTTALDCESVCEQLFRRK
jgi:hypothetical protein